MLNIEKISSQENEGAIFNNLNREQREEMQYYARFLLDQGKRYDSGNKNLVDKQIVPEGYLLDHILSNDKSSIYYNQNQQEAILCYRGTRTFSDLLLDAKIFVYNSKFLSGNYEYFTDFLKFIKKYKNDSRVKYRLKLAGFSLGGSIIQAILLTDWRHDPEIFSIWNQLMGYPANQISLYKDIERAYSYNPGGLQSYTDRSFVEYISNFKAINNIDPYILKNINYIYAIEGDVIPTFLRYFSSNREGTFFSVKLDPEKGRSYSNIEEEENPSIAINYHYLDSFLSQDIINIEPDKISYAPIFRHYNESYLSNYNYGSDRQILLQPIEININSLNSIDMSSTRSSSTGSSSVRSNYRGLSALGSGKSSSSRSSTTGTSIGSLNPIHNRNNNGYIPVRGDKKGILSTIRKSDGTFEDVLEYETIDEARNPVIKTKKIITQPPAKKRPARRDLNPLADVLPSPSSRNSKSDHSNSIGAVYTESKPYSKEPERRRNPSKTIGSFTNNEPIPTLITPIKTYTLR